MQKTFIDGQNETELLQSDFFLFFTKDRNLLDEYDDIRAECYSEITGLPTVFDKSEHVYDAIADHLIITYKDIVIGGARIVGKYPGANNDIPMDSDELSVEELFPDLELGKVPYCEFTRLAILKDFRSTYLLQHTLAVLSAYAVAKGYRHIFSVSPESQARCYRQVFKAIEMPNTYQIYKELEVPDEKGKYGELSVCLASMEFPNEWHGVKNRRNFAGF